MSFFPHHQNPNTNYDGSPPQPPSFQQLVGSGAAVPEFHFSDFLFPEVGDHDSYIDNNYSPDPQSFAGAAATPTTSTVQIGSGGDGDGGSWNSVGNDDNNDHQQQQESRSNGRDGYSEVVAHNRVAFKTKSELEVMDDGFKWRKYGKKSVKNTPNPRHYYKCSSVGCNVKKRVERDREDSSFVITTYEGVHTHESPSSIHYASYTTQTRPYHSSSSSPSST